jgi:ribonucleoside-triphosphate reductase (formate)
MAAKQIINRKEEKIPYNIYKIKLAILKALDAIDNPDIDLADYLTKKVDIKLTEEYFNKKTLPKINDIQDTIEDILIKEGFTKLVKAYVIYRRQHDDFRNLSKLIDSTNAVESYINISDWQVKENSNMDYSLQGLNNYLSTKIISDYWIKKIYPPEIKEAHEKRQLHIHDLNTLGSYCVGWDLQSVLQTGFRGSPGKVVASPPKHLDTALGQIVNFIYTLQGESAGAQAFSNFDTLLAPFIRYDNLDYAQTRASLEKFIYNMNVPTRTGFQTPFSNITLDLTVPSTFKDQAVIIGGKSQDKTYGDFQKEMDIFNMALLDVLYEGDAIGNMFSFPIPTINVTKDFDWSTELANKIIDLTIKYGTPYFANFVNSDMKPEDARSMCCRLRLDNRELQKRGGGLFGSNPLTGSIGVVTINLAQLGYLSKSEEEYFEKLAHLMDLAKKSLDIKRKIVEKYTDDGLYPYSKFNLKAIKDRFDSFWKNHFSTIGLLGLNESAVNFLGEGIYTEKGQAFAIKVMDFMRDRILKYQEETGNLYNLEATPGESTTYRFASYDKEKYPSIIVANEENYINNGAQPYYTNSSQLPVNYSSDIFEVLELQDELQCKYTGGTVIHIFIGEKKPSREAIKLLIQKITTRFKLPYFTFTPTFSVCPKHGYIFGEHEFCPICDEEIGYKEEIK